MCRSIRTLFNYDPPSTPDEVRAASLQFVRKVSGFSKPSEANREPFEQAVDEISESVTRLLSSLVTRAEPRDRAEEIAKARARAAERRGAAF